MLASRLRSRFVPAGLLLSALLASCGDSTGDGDDDDCDTGTEDCACTFGGNCDDGLVCNDKRRCVDEDGAAGESGSGGSTSFGGKGGASGSSGAFSSGGVSASSGSGGGVSTGGFAGDPGPGSGGVSGRGGSTGGTFTAGEGGEAGEAAAGGEGPSGGKAGAGGKGGTGGTAGEGGSGGTGDVTCTEITISDLVAVHTASTAEISSATFLSRGSPLAAAATDLLGTSFFTGDGYDGERTGSFTLGTGDEDNYETCQRCVLFRRDADTSGERLFFATSGQLVIDEGSLQTTGFGTFTLTDVTLSEVTLDEFLVSAPVLNGLCLHLASGSVSFEPEDWSCDPGFFGSDDGCDCGCTGSDPDCANADIVTCEYCHCVGDDEQCAPTSVDPEDTRMCLPTAPGGGGD